MESLTVTGVLGEDNKVLSLLDSRLLVEEAQNDDAMNTDQQCADE